MVEMESKTQTAVDRKPQRLPQVDQGLLSVFWTLADGNDNERVQAAEKLLKRLKEDNIKNPDVAKTELDYCLQRLIRGLASSRSFARVGYAVALTKLLREVPGIKVDNVLNLVTEQLKVSQHDPKSEVGSTLLGRVFAYEALVQSEKLFEGNHIETVMLEIDTLSAKRSYIRPSCTQCLLDIVKRVSPEVFAETVWPKLSGELGKGWEECTADRLLLLIACRQKDTSLVDKAFLKKHWGASKILDKKNYDHLLHLIMRSMDMVQLLPLLLESVVKEVTTKDCDVAEFWTKVGNPLLTSTLPRKQAAMSLFSLLFPHISDAEQMQRMVFPAVATLLCKTAEHKDSQLLDICSKAESLITEWSRKQEEGSGVLDVVKGFQRTAHRLSQTGFLRSATFSSIISALKGQDVQMFAQICMDSVLGKNTFAESGEEAQEAKPENLQKMNQQLVLLLHQTTLNPTVQGSEFQPRVLKFLFLHTFFKVTKATKDITHCQEESPSLSPALRGHCQTTFYRILQQLLSTRTEGTQQDQVLKYIRVLADLAEYTQQLLSSSKNVQPVKEISEEVQAEWKSVMDVVKGKDEKKPASTSLGESEAFKLLILHLAFDLFVEPAGTMELLQDVYVCHKKAVAKSKKSKANKEGEPHWVEVVVEVLLSMLSRPSKLARKTTVAVFKSLSSHLTPAALSLITQVLKADKSKKGPDDELFDFEDANTDQKSNGKDEDESGEEDEEMVSDDDSDDDGGDDDKDDDNDEEDEEEEEADDVVDEEFRKSVKEALGPAAVDSENEEEEEDLSDSEMFKLDEKLIAAFRSMKRPTKKERKEKQQEVGNFRLRVLDLVEVVVKSDCCGELGLELLEPLVKLAVTKVIGPQGKGQPQTEQQLCNRAREILHVLFKQRNLSDTIHTQEEMLGVLNTLLQIARTVTIPQLVAEVSNSCLFIMRLMTHQPDASPSPVKTRAMRESESGKTSQSGSSEEGQNAFVQAIQSALEEDLLVKKNSTNSMTFFTSMINKYPMVFWPLMSTLVKVVQSPDVKVHKKTQACSLMAVLLKMNKRVTLSDEEWNNFVQSASPAFRQLILQQEKGNLKSRLVLDVLTVLFHIAQQMSEEERKTLLPEEVLTHLTELKSAFNKDTRVMHSKLTLLLFREKKREKKEKNKNKKRKHQETDETATNGHAAKKAKRVTFNL